VLDNSGEMGLTDTAIQVDDPDWSIVFLVLVPIGAPIVALGFLLVRQFSPPISKVMRQHNDKLPYFLYSSDPLAF
jgi:hypothetical protein